jgi:hypothetical protein
VLKKIFLSNFLVVPLIFSSVFSMKIMDGGRIVCFSDLNSLEDKLQINSNKFDNARTLTFLFEKSRFKDENVCKITEIIKKFSDSKRLKHISLELKKNNIGNSIIDLLKEISELKIESLFVSLGCNPLTTEYVGEIMNEIGKMTSLRTLDLILSGNDIGNEEAIKIANGINKLNLKNLSLDLRNNNIGNEGAFKLGGSIKNLFRLKNLKFDFSDNSISKLGPFVNEISLLAKKEELKKLTLSFLYNRDDNDQLLDDEELENALTQLCDEGLHELSLPEFLPKEFEAMNKRLQDILQAQSNSDN